MNEGGADGGTQMLSLVWSGALSVVLALFGLVSALRSRELDTVKSMAKDAMQRADDAKTALAAHKLHAAENFATRKQVEDLNRKLDERFDRLDDRLDELKDSIRERLN